MFLRGEPVHIGSPREAIGLKIGMVHQHFMLIPVMTVAENVVLASEPTKGALLDRDAAEERVRELSSASASASTRAPTWRTSASASSSASRSSACCTAAPTC